MSQVRGLLAAIVLVTVAATARPARADWPMARGNAARTGATTGTSNLVTPLPYWRQFLGGALDLPQMMVLGTNDVAYLGGGRLRVVSFEGIPRWSSANLALTQVVATADLDDDGELELVAQSSDRVFVFDATAGNLRWAETPGEMGTIGGVRVADVDGVGGSELVIQECYCCQIQSGTPGVVYSFDNGFASPRLVWRLSESACAGPRAMLIDELTGDGVPDFVVTSQTDVKILDGRTGAIEATSGAMGFWITGSYCEAVEIVGGGGKELVCALSINLAPTGTGHRVFVLQYQTGPARLQLLWQTNVGDLDGELQVGAGHIVDLDGDGTLEITVSGTRTDGEPVTEILDAVTGQSLATLEGVKHVGSVAATPTETVYLTEANHNIDGWGFQRSANPRLTHRWAIKDRRPLVRRDWWLAKRAPLSRRLATADVNADGIAELLLVDLIRPAELHAYDALTPAEIPLVTWTGRPGSQVLVGAQGSAALVVSTSDGRLTTLDPASQPIGSFRAGQYYDNGGWLHLPTAPVIGDLSGDAKPELAAGDSRQYLLALDARDATNAAPPRLLWELASSTAPSIAPELGALGSPGLVCRRTDTTTLPPVSKIARVDGEGALIWESVIGGVAAAPVVFNDVVSGNFDGDVVPDVSVQWGLGSDALVRTTAFRGSDGQELWTVVTGGGETRFPSGHSVGDWNGDGRDDVVFNHYGVHVLSGVDGTEVATSAPEPTTYAMVTLTDIDGDSQLDASFSGSIAPSRTVSHSFSPVWTSTDDKPYPYSATTTCGSRRVLVSSSMQNSARLKATTQSGASAGEAMTVVLAGGRLFADEATAIAAGAPRGQLTSVHVHSNLTGAGRPTAVVGSSDGWLYGVNPCTMTLDFVVSFDSPVGGAAFGDLDNDGLDELVVSVADGYLYGVKNAPLAGPFQVRDIDVRSSSLDDVDEVVTRDTLSASWDMVPNAIGYEVAIAYAEGGYLMNPPWRQVDATTFTEVGLPLEDGGLYVVSVRALSSAGPSPDVLSDGVLVRFPTGDDAGPDAGETGPRDPGGCCSSTRRPTGAIALGLLVFLLVAVRRVRVPCAKA
jgi:hypothetical protein